MGLGEPAKALFFSSREENCEKQWKSFEKVI